MLYSTLIACLIEVFLITNIDMLVTYLVESGSSLAPFTMIFRMGTVTTILYVLFGIMICSFTFLLLQRRSLKYIGKIANAVQNISEGDLNTEIEVLGDDEFSMIAANLNRMEEEIRELMDKERESERTKNELITNVAHDLRTPLTSIIGYLELLSKGIPLPQEMQQKYIEIVYTKAKRLEKLIEDLFGFTKVGKVSMNVGTVDIVKLLGQLLEEFYPSFADKELVYELISNVPATLLLSGFTDNWRELLSGVNIGGLGTPVASLASLITLKFYLKLPNAKLLRFAGVFTLANLIGLIVLTGFQMIFFG